MKPRRDKFVAQLVRWRKQRKLTKADAARLLGVPYRTLQDWELGNRTPGAYARRALTPRISRRTARD